MPNIVYEIRTSIKAKHARITLFPNGRVLVTKPTRIPLAKVTEFVRRKESWIRKKLEFYKNRKIVELGPKPRGTQAAALAYVKSRVEFYNQHYKFVYNKISIKNNKSLWGSCSVRKNLSFNHRIVDLTREQADYIIIHELCHLREFNHSKKFWALVTETIPDYRRIKNELRNYSIS